MLAAIERWLHSEKPAVITPRDETMYGLVRIIGPQSDYLNDSSGVFHWNGMVEWNIE